MTRGLATLLVVLALSAALLPGCVGLETGGEPVTAGDAASDAAPATEASARESDHGNATRGAVASRNHSHDYWNGETEIVVHDETTFFFPRPVMPRGEGSTPASRALVKLEPPHLVLEGTSEVVVRVDRSLLAGVSDPAPPGLAMRHRTAADAEWREPAPVTPGEPLVIPVAPHETDAPHSAASLWAFEFVTDRADVGWIDVTVTIVKGRDVPQRPGHPDAYAHAPARVLLDTHVSAHRSGLTEWLLYGEQGSWTRPTAPVAPGTRELHAFVNVTYAASAMPSQRPVAYALEYHNATVLDAEDEMSGWAKDENATVDDDGTAALHFVIEPDVNGLDGPYTEGSAWGFRLIAFFEDAGAPGVASARFCGGCFDYELEYDVRVVALGPAPADA